MDVQPAILEDGWDTEPFVLTEKDGKLFGRGASDDKGPVLGWIHAIEAYQAINEPLPVNLKFVFEGEFCRCFEIKLKLIAIFGKFALRYGGVRQRRFGRAAVQASE